jgi:hypothetical protein
VSISGPLVGFDEERRDVAWLGDLLAARPQRPEGEPVAVTLAASLMSA